MASEDGFEKCRLGKYQTSLVQDDHYVPTQVLFVGTPDPFHYDERGERIYSRPEELQYGNSIKGVDEIWVGLKMVSIQDYEIVFDEFGAIERDDNGIPIRRERTRRCLKPVVKFVKRTSGAKDLVSRIQDSTTYVPAGKVKVVISHKNVDNIAKYHILNRSSSLYFNGSLSKNGKNQFKFSDFKYSMTVDLELNEDGVTWQSR